VRETTLQTPSKVHEEGVGKRCSRHQSRESSLAARDEDHGEAGCPPAVHGGLQWGTYAPVACGSHAGAGGCLKEAVTRGKPTLEQAPARTCGHMERGAQAITGLLAGFVTLWGTHAGAACS